MATTHWQGHWIAQGEPDGHDDSGHRPQEPQDLPPVRDFQRLIFRREFDTGATTGELQISADSRYVAYLNGVELGRGPVRSQPHRWTHDTWPLDGALTEGSNTLVVVVTWYGRANSMWAPATPEPGLGGRPAMIAQLTLDGEPGPATGRGWEVATAEAWTEPPRAFYDGVPVEQLDLRLLPERWTHGARGELAWGPAALISASHLGGLARTRPPAAPYGLLQPRPIAPLAGPTHRPLTTAAWPVGGAAPVGPRPTTDVATALSRERTEPAPLGSDPVRLAAGEQLLLEVDFGRVLVGLVDLAIETPEGTVVDMLHRDRRVHPGLPAQPEPHTGARLVTSSHSTRFHAHELAGLRQLYLLVRPPAGGEVRLESLRLHERTQPWQGSAHFTSSRPDLDALWRAGVRTTQVCSLDAFVDTPSREQRSWVGDGVVAQMVHLVSNADWRSAWRYLELSDSPRDDGLLPMAVAGETEGNHGVTIPAWSLYWVHGVHQMWRHDPDVERVAALLPDVRRVLAWFARHVDDSGVIGDLPEWNLVDWSSVFLSGRSSILTALWARALRQYAEICTALGDTHQTRWAQGLVAGAAAGFDQFWEPNRGCYVDHASTGARRLPASQFGQAAALLSGLVPGDRRARVRAWMSHGPHLVERTLLQTHGVFDAVRHEELMRGVQRVDWNVLTESVVAAPFGSHLVHEAYWSGNRPDAVLLASLGRWQQFLTGGYDTFGEQWGVGGSPAHAWSSCPTLDLSRAVLGVQPAAAGYARARVAPALGLAGLTDRSPDALLSGRVPTPTGEIDVHLEAGELRVESPVPVEVHLDGHTHLLDAGRHTLAREVPALSRTALR